MNIKLLVLCITIFALILILGIIFIFIRLFEKYHDINIWTYWEPNPPPPKVKKCYENWKKIGKLNNIHLLNPDNITEYIPQDEYDKICKNAENPAVKSDFIGLYLLHKYGGVWIDASIFLNKPLLEWLPLDKMFTYNADRFNDVGTCMETFFMYSPKDNIISKEWYHFLHKIKDNEGKEKFLENAKEEYPDICNAMDSNYLWVYLTGKYLLLKNPEFKEHLNYKSAEKGPWFACEKYGWDNIKQICEELEKKNPCELCEMTKLHSVLRDNCDDDIIPT